MELRDFRFNVPGFTDERYIAESGYATHVSAYNPELELELALIHRIAGSYLLMLSRPTSAHRNLAGVLSTPSSGRLEEVDVDDIDPLSLKCIVIEWLSNLRR